VRAPPSREARTRSVSSGATAEETTRTPGNPVDSFKWMSLYFESNFHFTVTP
jgi:hypothetical protein